MSVVLAAAAAILFGLGTWLLLQRRLSRIIIGLGLIGHGSNVLLLISAGRRGRAIFVDAPGPLADPMPQALALTAIVITFGVVAFLLALAWRRYELTGDDLVEDDVEDRRIAAQRRTADEEIADELALVADQADETRVSDDDEDEHEPLPGSDDAEPASEVSP
ncbi:MAG: NADH-quinone oxidoreductase subunit K [Acidimicrobiales bacterium]|nr:NADH-quinone oxidoreductase subunit K [Acidimicrobiales bacterium]